MSYMRENITVQGIGSAVEIVNQMRTDQLINNLKIQDINFDSAISELDKAREFLGSPDHILGSLKQKHGEVAEVFDVRFGNADMIIRGETPNFTFEGVGRTAPEDYLKNNLPVQSKFVQKNLSMDAVLGHLDKYPDFVQKGGTYCIPKDFYEQIEVWMKLSNEELARIPASEGGKLAESVIKRIQELEAKTGKKFTEIVEASQSKYGQVQLKCAGKTIELKELEIVEVDNQKREEYWQMAQASVRECFKVAGISAAISGVITFATSLVSKLKSQNKKLGDLTKEDWAEIFKDTGIGATKGGVSGGAIYALTNVAGMSAHFAAALVSATLGVATQAVKLYKHEISFDDFMYNIHDVATEAAVSGVGAFAGQMLIPVPGLGAIIGSLVTTTILNIVKKYIFGGSFYESVKAAHQEKEFSDTYKPLIEAFEKSSNEWRIIDRDITAKLRPYINQSEQSFANKAGNLHNYIGEI